MPGVTMVLFGTGVLIYLVSRLPWLIDRRERWIAAILASLGCMVVAREIWLVPSRGLIVDTDIALAATMLTLAAAIYSAGYMGQHRGIGKFFALLMFMAGGMTGVVMTRDIFSLYIAFEAMSVASYSLVSYDNEKWEPVEAGIKYMMMNVTGALLAALGIGLLFLSAGTLDMEQLATLALRDNSVNVASIVLIMLGFGVKAAAVPMHMWLPDAHTAAPTSVSALLSGIVVPVGLYGMIKVLASAFLAEHRIIGGALLALALVTMLLGNIAALTQSDIKRMLAYSSIAQTGYMMLGFGLGLGFGSGAGLEGALFHVVTNASMKSLAFFAVGIMISAVGSREISDLRGIGKQYPVAATAFAVSCLSLAGVPPLAGFMSKVLIYKAGFETGGALGYIASGLATACSVLSLGYYLPAVARLFEPVGIRQESGQASRLQSSSLASLSDLQMVEASAMYVPVIVLAIVTISLGLYPGAPLDHAAFVTATTIRNLVP